jgi:ligand-binding SRPBCC domain-containing protein
LGSLRRTTHLPSSVDQALATSLDLDVELAVGKRWRLKALPGGYGFRRSGVMARGEMVRWSMRLWGVLPVRHTSKIVQLVEDDGTGEAMFVDEMTTGVFAAYRHEHRFTREGGGTAMVDDVTWRSPLGPLGALADRLFVRRLMERLVDDRNAEIQRRLTDPSPD